MNSPCLQNDARRLVFLQWYSKHLSWRFFLLRSCPISASNTHISNIQLSVDGWSCKISHVNCLARGLAVSSWFFAAMHFTFPQDLLTRFSCIDREYFCVIQAEIGTVVNTQKQPAFREDRETWAGWMFLLTVVCSEQGVWATSCRDHPGT